MKTTKAKFITIEGIEGVGKSTCLGHIVQTLEKHTIPMVTTREPGGTEIAESIRTVLLQHYTEPMCHDTELLLAFAGRAQHIATIIKPALMRGDWVVCDRFTDATYAYQGGGRGIDSKRISAIEQWVHPELQPDLTLLLHAPVNIALERAKGRGELDRIELEKSQFFERVQQTYFELAKQSVQRYQLIDASKSPKLVKNQVESIVHNFIAQSYE